MKFTALLISAISALVVRASDSIVARSVAPPITYPTEGLSFGPGATFNVTWDTSSLLGRHNITNPWAAILLRTNGRNLPLILAGNVNITQGYAPVTVPWLTTNGTYQVVLFGNSGNFSPNFTITSPNPTIAPKEIK